MALTKQKDKVELAAAKAASATNLFAVAANQLQQATDLLDESLVADQAAVADLQARIARANQLKLNNAKVVAKLQEFVA